MSALIRPLKLLFAFAVALTGCDARHGSTPPASQPPAASQAGKLRYLALGDSYTIGESVETAERWPVQLSIALRKLGFDVADPEIIARTGWRTDDLDAAITRTNPQGSYDLVSVLIGVNNQFQGRAAADYRKEFPALLTRAIALAGGDPKRVIVLSIPDWSATPFGQSSNPSKVAREIDAFNAINREASSVAGVGYVDVTPISRQAPQQPDLVASDGLHPSGKMYAEWVKLAVPAAKSPLATPATQPQ